MNGRKRHRHRPPADDDLEPPGTPLPADDRDRAAEARDRESEARDTAAEARDDKAMARDDRAEVREHATDPVDQAAAFDRVEASRDRSSSAADRTHASSTRQDSASDRRLSVLDRAAASIDALTGAYMRDPGVIELQREVTRAQRTHAPFVLAFLDVDGLKAANDSLGHAAGDVLLAKVAETLEANLRPYDLIVRFGGDEFVCGMQDVHLVEAEKRFAGVNADLATEYNASVSVGLAQLEATDTLEDLIRRADADLYRRRGRGRPPP